MVNANRPTLVVRFIWGCALSLAGHGFAQSELPKSSPFLSAGTPAAASAPGESIEFAAVRTIGKRTEIDLYDTQGKKNHWIPLGGTADGMTVVTYDARRDQVTATIGGVQKLLTLRQTHGGTAGNVAVTIPPGMDFSKATPSPPAAAAPIPIPTDTTPSTDANATPATPSATPAQPAAPLTIARQEEEARMLVSDLLEIGMAQRKAYEEKQKQAASPTAMPAQSLPAAAPAPIPSSPPGGE